MIWCRFREGQARLVWHCRRRHHRRRRRRSVCRLAGRRAKFKLSDVKLLVPVIPGTFYAIGSNYHNHVVEPRQGQGHSSLNSTTGRASAIAPTARWSRRGEDIVKPKDAGPRFEYEGELVAVIGKTGAATSRPSRRADCILGWTIGNDVTERDWQRDDPTNLRGKNADTFKPMGPVTSSTGIDPATAT